MTYEQPNMKDVIASELNNPDLRGLYYDDDGMPMLDRRLTSEAIERRGLSPRTADLNIIGPDCVEVPRDLLKANGRAAVKSRLLESGKPGVNL